MYHILFNDLAGNGRGAQTAEEFSRTLTDAPCALENIREIGDLPTYLSALPREDEVILVGGDGTLSRFANDLDGVTLHHKLYYYPAGSGNDFAKDVADAVDARGLIPLNRYITHLPTVTVNGMTRKFINGIGFGIDGYCCEVGDKLRAEGNQKINYTAIAIKGLLFHYTPVTATVTVDGVTYTYPKAWIAPSMKGRFYGGGMMVAPEQDRLSEQGKLSFVTLFGSGRVGTLMIFPDIFKGKLGEHKKNVRTHTGHRITVRFDRPCALQIDGETVLDVTEYTVTSGRAPTDR